MFGVLGVTSERLAHADTSVGDRDEDLFAVAAGPANDVVIGLDGGVGPERGDAVLGGVRADLRERRADRDPLAQAVALVLQDLRDPLDDPRYLFLGVEVDQLLQRPGLCRLRSSREATSALVRTLSPNDLKKFIRSR